MKDFKKERVSAIDKQKNMEKFIKKWMPIIDTLSGKLAIDDKERLCFYAEHYALIESKNIPAFIPIKLPSNKPIGGPDFNSNLPFMIKVLEEVMLSLRESNKKVIFSTEVEEDPEITFENNQVVFTKRIKDEFDFKNYSVTTPISREVLSSLYSNELSIMGEIENIHRHRCVEQLIEYGNKNNGITFKIASTSLSIVSEATLVPAMITTFLVR